MQQLTMIEPNVFEKIIRVPKSVL